MEFNSLFGLGRIYKKLPPHQNAKELSDNLEVLANYFLYRGSRDVLHNPGRGIRWEWKLGQDLRMLVELARVYIPDDTYTKRPPK